MSAIPSFSRCKSLFAGLGVSAWAGFAFAQTASQIAPQTFEPQLQKQGHGFAIPEISGQSAPPGAEKLKVRIGIVKIDGGFASLADAEVRFSGELAGKTVSAADLFAAANTLAEVYAARGYGLVRVVLPAQRLTDGATLRLTVIDGFIERIDTTHLPANIRVRVDHLLAPLAGQQHITNGEIERRVLLAGDLPGTVLRSALSQGKKRGGSVLTLEARYKPVTGSFSLDNSLSDSLGRYSFQTGLDFNSVLGFGELIYLRSSGAPLFSGDNGYFSDLARNRSLAGGVAVPLGNDGLVLNVEGTQSRTTSRPFSSGIVDQSDFSRVSTRLSYPLLRSRDITLNLNGVFDAEDEADTLLNTDTGISRDRLRVLRTGADFSWYWPSGALVSGNLTGSFGVNGLGARTLADANASGLPLSRQGADADFQKLEADVDLRDPLAEHLTLDIRARLQTSFGQPLLNAEQIGLAAPNGLSSFELGSIQGDAGFVIRGEAQFPFLTPYVLPFRLPEYPRQQGTGLSDTDRTTGGLIVSPYLFGAFGGVKLQDPTALEQAWTRAGTFGAGLRLGTGQEASFNSTTLNLEYGRAVTFGTGSRQNRFTFSLAYNF